MQPIGFSTGALLRDKLASGVEAAFNLAPGAVELSALRTRELDNLVQFVHCHALKSFRYVSIHAPTDYAPASEAEIAGKLLKIARLRNWSVVVHPDTIVDFDHWRPFGSLLCIENMDKRKKCGRTAEELSKVFAELPKANLCFDIAHAHQVDSTMTEAYRILRYFGNRLRQIHISELTASGKHAVMSLSALAAYELIIHLLPRETPIILESPTSPENARDEVQKVYALLSESTSNQSHNFPLLRRA